MDHPDVVCGGRCRANAIVQIVLELAVEDGSVPPNRSRLDVGRS